MIAHQQIGMIRLDSDRIDVDFVKTRAKKDANKKRSPPIEKRMKWFGLNHNSKSASVDAKAGLIISWFSSRITILVGVYFLKNASPIEGR